MTLIRRLSANAWFVTMGLMPAASAFAQGFGGQIPAIPGTPGPIADEAGIRDIVLDVLKFVLNFLALIAVAVIVIAGLYLIFSQGADDQKDKAKKLILFTVIGLIVVMFARVIVSFFTIVVPDVIGS